MDKFESINNTQLEQIDGGIAPVVVAAGILAAGAGGFVTGYRVGRAIKRGR